MPSNEPVCFPVCPKCKDGCELSSKVKPAPTSTKKVRRWAPDMVLLKCGQIIPAPILKFGDKTEIWCETHGAWEKLAVKQQRPKKWKDSDEPIPF